MKNLKNNDNIILIIIITITKNHFTTEKADKHYISKMIRWIPRLINYVDSIYPLYDIIKKQYISVYNPQKQFNHEINNRQVPTEGNFTKYSTPQSFPVHQQQGKAERLSQSRGA